MLLNKSKASYHFIYGELKISENQNFNARFNLHLLKQCYHKVYQSILKSEIKRVYHY